jgi:type I restriction enzyme S subunit
VNWKTVCIGDICNLSTGGTPSRTNPEYFDNGTINWLVSGDINKREIFECDGKITELGYKNSNAKYLPVNSVLIALNGQGKTRGSVAILRIKATCNQSLVAISPKNNEDLDTKYLFYCLDSKYEEIRKLTGDSGNDRRGLNMPLIRKIKINVPDIATQTKIVEKLDAIFAEIDKATAAAEANAKNAEALFQSYLTQVFDCKEDGWKQTNLKDIAEYFNGLTYSPKNVSEEGTIVLRSSNVQSDKILLDDIVRVNSTIKEKVYVRNGDILMCSRNGSQRLVGKTATIENLDEKMTFGTFMMIVRSESNFFIQWFFKSDLFKRQIASGENTMINQITRYMLDEIVIPMPDLSTQKSISKKISSLYSTSQRLKLSYVKKVDELNYYKKSILNQAFNGELFREY